MIPSNGNLALLLRPLLPSVSERVYASQLGCDLLQKNASGHHRSLPKFQWLSPTVVYSLLTQSTMWAMWVCLHLAETPSGTPGP